MKNARQVNGSALGAFKLFAPIMPIFSAIHTLLMISPTISGHILGPGNDLIFRALIVALILSFAILFLVLKYYKSNNAHRAKIVSAFFPKQGWTNLEKLSLGFLLAFAISLIGYILILEVSSKAVQNIFGDAIIEPRQKLSYMVSYIIISPIVAITYLRFQD